MFAFTLGSKCISTAKRKRFDYLLLVYMLTIVMILFVLLGGLQLFELVDSSGTYKINTVIGSYSEYVDRFQNIIVDEENRNLYYLHGTTIKKVCLANRQISPVVSVINPQTKFDLLQGKLIWYEYQTFKILDFQTNNTTNVLNSGCLDFVVHRKNDSIICAKSAAIYVMKLFENNSTMNIIKIINIRALKVRYCDNSIMAFVVAGYYINIESGEIISNGNYGHYNAISWDCYAGNVYFIYNRYSIKMISMNVTITIIGDDPYKGETPDGILNYPTISGAEYLSIDKSTGDIYFIENWKNIRKISGRNLSTIIHYNDMFEDPKLTNSNFFGVSESFDKSGLFIRSSYNIMLYNLTTSIFKNFAGCGYLYCGLSPPGTNHGSFADARFQSISTMVSTSEGIYLFDDGVLKLLCSNGTLLMVMDTFSTMIAQDLNYYLGDLYFRTNVGIWKMNTQSKETKLLIPLSEGYMQFVLVPNLSKIYYIEYLYIYVYDLISSNTTTCLNMTNYLYYLNVDERGVIYFYQYHELNIFKPASLESCSQGDIQSFSGNSKDYFIEGEPLKDTTFRSVKSVVGQDGSLFILDLGVVRKIYMDCDIGFIGPYCDNLTSCFGKDGNNSSVCFGRGPCVGFDTCNCSIGFEGRECELEKCFGLSKDDPLVCSSHGLCLNGECICYSNYRGSNCLEWECYGIIANNSHACNSNGECTPNGCSCFNDYFGNECQFYSCFGFRFNDSGVCTGNGVCSSYNNCTCYNGFNGSDCSQLVDQHISNIIINSTYGNSSLIWNETIEYHYPNNTNTDNNSTNMYNQSLRNESNIQNNNTTLNSTEFFGNISNNSLPCNYFTNSSDSSYNHTHLSNSTQITMNITNNAINMTLNITINGNLSKVHNFTQCDIYPTIGITLITKFTLNCSDLEDVNNTTIFRILYKHQMDSSWNLLEEQISNLQMVILPQGDIFLKVIAINGDRATQSNIMRVNVHKIGSDTQSMLDEIDSNLLSIPEDTFILSLPILISNYSNHVAKYKIDSIISKYLSNQKDHFAESITPIQFNSSLSIISIISSSVDILESNITNVVIDYFQSVLISANKNIIYLSNENLEKCLAVITFIENQILSHNKKRDIEVFKIIGLYKELSDLKSKSLKEEETIQIQGRLFKSLSTFLKGPVLFEKLIFENTTKIHIQVTDSSHIVSVNTYSDEPTENEFSKKIDFNLFNITTRSKESITNFTREIARFSLVLPLESKSEWRTLCKYQTESGIFNTTIYCHSSFSKSENMVVFSIFRTGSFMFEYNHALDMEQGELSQKKTDSATPIVPIKLNESLIIGLSVSFPILLLFSISIALFVVIIVKYKTKSSCDDSEKKVDVIDVEMDYGLDFIDFMEPQVTLVDVPLFIPHEELTLISKIGSGGFGTVYKTEYSPKGREKTIVAVKSILNEDALLTKTSDLSEIVSKEAKLMRSLDHPNIVKCLGVSIKDNIQFIVMEYVEGGSLQELIYDLKLGRISLDLEEKINILLQIACGVNYLHSLPKPIVHRDLKPGNCLITRSKMTCKLCDFGLSKAFSNSSMNSSVTNNIGTLHYMAVEIMVGEGDKELVKSIDVYSFAILMWELLFEDNPYIYKNLDKLFFEKKFTESEYCGLNGFNTWPKVVNGLRPVIPFQDEKDCLRWTQHFIFSKFTTSSVVKCWLSLKHLLQICWQANAQQRPSFEEIISTLNSVNNNLEMDLWI